MAETERVIWGIHAGETGDAEALFLQRNCVAIGWTKMGDLATIAPNREALKARVADTYPERKPGAIPVMAGQLYRFVHEMKAGDLVVYPSKRTREIHIGEIVGPYAYDQTHEPGYPNRRPVKWLGKRPRTSFTQGALYEIGSAMSLFLLKNYAHEFLAALEGKAKAPSLPPEEDDTVSVVAQEIEQTTRDFVLKRLAQELKGHPLADFVAHLLEKMGYRTRVSPPGPDGGVDIIAHEDELGFKPPIVKVQVKGTEGSIGDPVVKSLFGNIEQQEYGLFVALGTFTPQARNFERSKSNLRLIDGQELVDLVLLHYDELDSRYKGLIPLKRVYVPEALEESEG